MLHRLLLTAVLAQVALAAFARAEAVVAAGAVRASSANGSVLRQVAGVEGVSPWRSDDPLATGEVEQAPFYGAPIPPQADLHWASPYATTYEPSPIDGNAPGGGWADAGSAHRGLGDPLRGTSWLNRPLHAGWFAGEIDGDELIDGRVRQRIGFFGGYRFGVDYHHYWGWETRLGGAALRLDDPREITSDRTSDLLVWDVSLLYYPWGDARLRPYATIGAGMINFDFLDDQSNRFDELLFELPIGFGIKYRVHEWLILRGEMLDNIAFGSAGIETMHNPSLTAGVEVRFGGVRKSYWPWNPSRYIW